MKVGNNLVNIKTCTEEKDLGVTFDNILKFNVHIQNAVSTPNTMIGILRRTFTFLDKDTFLQLYRVIGHMLNMAILYGIHICIANQLQLKCSQTCSYVSLFHFTDKAKQIPTFATLDGIFQYHAIWVTQKTLP